MNTDAKTQAGSQKLEVSPKQVLRLINDNFNNRLREIIAGANENYKPLELGKPTEPLLGCGIPDLPIQMSVQKLIDKKVQANHRFSLVSVVHMPEYLSDPIAIFQSKTYVGRKVILTEMQEKGTNLVVAMELQKLKGKIEVNDVRSIYPKDNVKDILKWIVEDGLMEYCHKQKILDWLDKQQSNSAEVIKLIEDTTNIVQAA